MVPVADPAQPTWSLTVLGAFDGPVHAALLTVGEISGASSFRVINDEMTGPMLDATLVAPDERAARALAISVPPAGATIFSIRKA